MAGERAGRTKWAETDSLNAAVFGQTPGRHENNDTESQARRVQPPLQPRPCFAFHSTASSPPRHFPLFLLFILLPSLPSPSSLPLRLGSPARPASELDPGGGVERVLAGRETEALHSERVEGTPLLA